MRALLPLAWVALASCGACGTCATVFRAPDVVFDATPTSAKVGEPVTVRFSTLNEADGRKWKVCVMPEAASLNDPQNCVDVPAGGRVVTVTAQAPGASFVRVYSDHLNDRRLDNWIVAASSRVQVTQ